MTSCFIQWFYRLAAIGWVVAILYLALTPVKMTPGVGYDKANHLIAFLLLAWLVEGGWPGPELAWRRYGWLICYAFFIESIQYYLPEREASWFDLAADLLGLTLYPALKRAWPKVWARLRQNLDLRTAPKHE